LEAILGFRKEGDRLTIEPCVPMSWREYRIDYRFGRSVYSIVVANPDGVEWGAVDVTVDGRAQDDSTIVLVDDGERHDVQIRRTAVRSTRVRAGS
jgi:cellobiose phosphorylase